MRLWLWMSMIVLHCSSLGCGGAQLVYAVDRMKAARPTPRGSACMIPLIFNTNRAHQVVAKMYPRGELARSAYQFHYAVAGKACHIGGDAIIASINARGHYVGGKLIRWANPCKPGEVDIKGKCYVYYKKHTPTAASCESSGFLGSRKKCKIRWHTCDDDNTYKIECSQVPEGGWNCNCLFNDVKASSFASPNFCGDVSAVYRENATNEKCGWLIKS